MFTNGLKGFDIISSPVLSWRLAVERVIMLTSDLEERRGQSLLCNLSITYRIET